MRGAPSELTAPTRRHMITVVQILDPETSHLFIDIEGDVLTGGQDFLQSSVQQECFRADRPSARLCLDGPRSNCALLRHSGTCVRVAGGHADRKRWWGLELRQWCCPGKKLAGSGLGPSRFLRRRTWASKRAYLGRYWADWGVLRPANCMNKTHKLIHAIIGLHRCCESSTAVAIAAEVRRKCEKCRSSPR